MLPLAQLGAFSLREGISSKQIAQLLAYTKTDAVVRRFSSDAERFKDEASANAWLTKGRTIYVMCDAQENLFGIVWFGSEQLPSAEYLEPIQLKDYQTTFAVRIYGEARGQHLARAFISAAHDAFKKTNLYQHSEAQGFWLETFVENAAAVAAYISFGYKQVTAPNADGKIIMIFK
ncbi:MAG TPA: hypothetical protein VFG51_03145 [Candidatus Saccharimonadia bacterium]|nr:hypothetical protein [Candidatus Saccharimonadia bacterium]